MTDTRSREPSHRPERNPRHVPISLPADHLARPPRKTTVEKYGSLFYAAVAGLVICVALVLVFALGVWSMRGVWAISTSSTTRSGRRWIASTRLGGLARDPRVTDRQKWDLATSSVPPPLARYLLAESLTAEATDGDPRAYALAVARSDGLPSFLLALLARPLAYAAAGGSPLDRESLREVESASRPGRRPLGYLCGGRGR